MIILMVPMKHQLVKNQEEFNNIILIKKGEEVGIRMERRKKARLLNKAQNFELTNEILFFKENNTLKEVVHAEDLPKMQRIVNNIHLEKHYGINKMHTFLNEHYFKISTSSIREIVNKCIACIKTEPLKTTMPMINIKAKRPRDRYQIDCIDLSRYKDKNNGYSYILNIIDVHSKFCMAQAIPNKSATTIVDTLRIVFFRNGFPKILQSDNGLEFKNNLMIQFCTKQKIIRRYSRPRHPQCNGQVERANQTITRWLAKHLHDTKSKTWIDIFDEIVYNYNISKHSATKKAPFKLFKQTLGFNTFLAENTDDNSTEEIIETAYYERMKRNAPSIIKKHIFKLGDSVLIKKDFDNNQKTKKQKLDSLYEESIGIIVEIFNETSFLVNMNGVEKRLLSSQLKLLK